jgi:predicted dienelactone hydrolase
MMRPLAIIGATAVLAVAAAPAPATVAGRSPPADSMHRRVLRLVDDSRRAQFRNGVSTPRVLVTDVRYPARGRAPFPLVVFGHGFALRPAVYTRLLDTWARAGYVVAAPAFPVERPDAPGGPDQSDLANEPRDISFVITRLTASASPLR